MIRILKNPLHTPQELRFRLFAGRKGQISLSCFNQDLVPRHGGLPVLGKLPQQTTHIRLHVK